MIPEMGRWVGGWVGLRDGGGGAEGSHLMEAGGEVPQAPAAFGRRRRQWACLSNRQPADLNERRPPLGGEGGNGHVYQSSA